MIVPPTTVPPKLKPGDTIGLISPAGPIKEAKQFQKGLEILENMGFQIRHSQLPQANENYLAAGDANRAKEFYDMWSDSQVQALMTTRGGYGCLRMIGLLDMKLLQAFPKLLLGFSDVTVLLNGILQQSGVVSLHGPVVCSLAKLDPLSLDLLRKALLGEMSTYNFANRIEVLRSGNSQGILRGGNLTTLVHMLGTPWELPVDNTILFLEDTGEALYKIDRMLTQLSLCGKLEKLSGLILGGFDSGKKINFTRPDLQEKVWQRVLELTRGMRFPIWGNFPVGHRAENIPMPIGMTANMNSDSSTLLFK